MKRVHVGALARPALVAAFLATSAEANVGDSVVIRWADLRQEQADPTLHGNGSSNGDTSSSYTASGQTIRLSGYMLPVDREDDLVYVFLLMQFAGACIHTPAPPPDQLVLVTLKKPFKSTGTYQPVSVTGTILADDEKVQLFMVDGVRIVESGYSIGSAFVLAADARAIK